MKYIVFDIDGVLADCSHRLKYIQGKDKDYDRFYSDEEIMKDKIIEAGRKIMDMLYNLYAMEDFYRPTEFYGKIILLTGRNEICKKATNTWVIKIYLSMALCILLLCDQRMTIAQLTKLRKI